jgi:hypothetical protein
MRGCVWVVDKRFSTTLQGPSALLANLCAPPAISATTSVHAVEQPGLPLENLSAYAPGAANLQCALKGGRPLPPSLTAK